jgi:splicing factor 3B subunit 3
MIGACEKQKFVYILNRDSSANLTISSPLEAHKSHGILFDCAGIDVGFENPLFACLEFDYEECDSDPSGEAIADAEKSLTFYELDLGLNHVARQSSESIPRTATSLFPVPGGTDGPGGVLVFCEDFVIHRSVDHTDCSATFPHRIDVPNGRGLIITCCALVKQRDWFFFLAQSEYGDLYKIMLVYEKEVVSEVKVIYFDTIPICNAMAVLKTGFLFAAVEAGNHLFYQFQAIGEDEDTETFELPITDEHRFFRPRAMKNLLLIDEMQAASPITDSLVANLFQEESPQIYALCGRGARSNLRIFRHGIAVTERAVSTLPGVPNAVWSVKTHVTDDHDKYIVLSFMNATMVLSIGETVEEVHDSGFIGTASTIHASLFGDDSLVQVYPLGIRHIRADKRIQEWQPPEGKQILLAAVNERQVVITVTGGDIFYFELDSTNRMTEIEQLPGTTEIVSLGIGPVPEGLLRSRFLAVADIDNKVKIYSLNPTDCLSNLSMQLLPSRVSALNIIEMSAFGGSSLYLNMGTVKGVLFRATIDKTTGQLSDTRARFLGLRPIKLFHVKVNGTDAVLALSSRTWLCYNYQGRYTMTPISYVPLEYASSFCSEQCPEGVVSVADETLRIFSTEQLDNMFNQTIIPLRYTPKKMVMDPVTKFLIIIEGDDDTYSYAEKLKLQNKIKSEETSGEIPVPKNDNDMEVQGEAVPSDSLPEDIFGTPRAGYGKWASCARILDISGSVTQDLFEFDNNEVAISICTCQFANREGEISIVIGTVQDLVFEPKRSATCGWIYIFSLINGGKTFQLVHKTKLAEIPGALCEFNGRLLVGCGQTIRLYELGKQKILRKCEMKAFPNHIISLWISMDKIVVGDIQGSYFMVKYSNADNKFIILVDDTIPRWLTSGVMLDPTTICGGDKFGNIFVLRLPDAVAQQIEGDPSAGQVPWNRHIIGAPYKFEILCSYYVGEAISKITKTSLTPGGTEILLYTTIFGNIGVLLPFSSRDDIEFFSNLEGHLRQEHKSLAGRDHLSFRSYYQPVKGVIDGDLCEQFPLATNEAQSKIASALERTPADILKKLEIMRNSIS